MPEGLGRRNLFLQRLMHWPHLERCGLLVLIAVFLIRNQHVVGALVFGVAEFPADLGGDSGRYTSGADRWVADEPLVGKQASYLGYILVLAGLRTLSLAYDWVMPVQLLFTAAAACAAFGLGRDVAGRLAGFLAALWLVENPDIAIWNRYLLTDSLYISSLVITLWAWHRAVIRWELLPLVAAVMLLLWTMTIRPNGWVLLPLMVTFLAFRLGAWKAVLTIALPGLVLLVVAVLLLKPLQSGIQNENPMDFLSKGIVIWDYDAWNRQMPPTKTDSTSDWRNIGSYAMRYPMETLTLVAARIGIVLARVRPYYPWQMNFRIGVRYIVMYGLLLLGIIWYWRHLAVKLLVAAIVLHLGVVGLTVASWDGRFLTHFFPLIAVLAGVGAAGWGRRWYLGRD